MADEIQRTDADDARPDDSYKRHGPEPPENDSGPSPSVDEVGGEARDHGRDSKREKTISDRPVRPHERTSEVI
jgi:hypothetical protein